LLRNAALRNIVHEFLLSLSGAIIAKAALYIDSKTTLVTLALAETHTLKCPIDTGARRDLQ